MSKRNIVHVEIPSVSVNDAGKFYADLFNWKIQPMPEMNYVMWETEDGSSGGFPEVSPESPAGQVLIYIGSDNIEADLNQVTKLGGTVVTGKTEIPKMGWFAVFKDPTGNAIGLFTSKNQ